MQIVYYNYTGKNLSACIVSLLTSRQQFVFSLLVSSCRQVWNKLLTICDNINLVDVIRLMTDTVVTILLQPCNILVISRLYQTFWNILASSLLMPPSSLLQVVNSLFQTCCNNMGTSSANTTRWQLVNRFVTTCLQTCNNLCVFTRV